MKRMLALVLLFDGVIAVGFGLYSYFAPRATFGTILKLPTTDSSLFLAMLSSMSIAYVLLGLACLAGVWMRCREAIMLGGVMVVRHAWSGVTKSADVGETWIIGNPYPDIAIHSVFVLAYIVVIALLLRMLASEK